VKKKVREVRSTFDPDRSRLGSWRFPMRSSTCAWRRTWEALRQGSSSSVTPAIPYLLSLLQVVRGSAPKIDTAH